MVVIVDGNQVAELKMSSQGRSFRGNSLHGAAISKEDKGVVVDEVEVGLVEDSLGVGLGNGETDSVGETLAERAGGDLNTGGVVSLGVTGGLGSDFLSHRQSVILPSQSHNHLRGSFSSRR